MSYEELMNKYMDAKNKYTDALVENENLKLENQNLKRIIYGVKREHTPKQEQLENSVQCSLFENNENIDK